MLLQLQIEGAAQSAHFVVIFADPFSAEFAIQMASRAEMVSHDAAPESLGGFKDRHLPFFLRQVIRGGES